MDLDSPFHIPVSCWSALRWKHELSLYFPKACCVQSNALKTGTHRESRLGSISALSHLIASIPQEWTNCRNGRMLSVLVSFCFCNKVPQIWWIRTPSVYHVTVREVRSLVWVSLGLHQSVGMADSFWRLQRRVCFRAFSSFCLHSCSYAPPHPPPSAKPAIAGHVSLMSHSWHWLLSLSSTFNGSCDYFGPTQETQDNFVLIQLTCNLISLATYPDISTGSGD